MANITVEVLEVRGWEDWQLPAFLAVINDAVSKIPQEHRAAAKVEMESDEYTPVLKVMYNRPETGEEIADRESRAAKSRAYHEQREREQYALLRAKFENKQ